jgi:hypothetical protein
VHQPRQQCSFALEVQQAVYQRPLYRGTGLLHGQPEIQGGQTKTFVPKMDTYPNEGILELAIGIAHLFQGSDLFENQELCNAKPKTS